MSTALTSVFGLEIKVAVVPRTSQRSYTGYPGAHGLTSMALGSRGYGLIVTGRLRASGVSYAAARLTLESAIAAIESLQWSEPVDYIYGSSTYYNVVLERFDIIPSPDGKSFRMTNSYVICDFRAVMRSLL